MNRLISNNYYTTCTNANIRQVAYNYATNNRLYTQSSFIGAGNRNCIYSLNISALCVAPNAANYSFIGSGSNNKIIGGAFSSILGGSGNTINAAYSAIFGGSGNTVNTGHTYAGVFGQGVSTVQSNAFHANNFVAQNMPMGTLVGGIPAPPSGLGSKGLWYYPDVNGNCVVYIK